ncbi:MAG TPA: hypothetical protein VMQ61_15635 [Thermoanaerobaculia bacterium]|nr:hypothetical protein [Thermoanaerobaculia bacterium]
MKRRVGFTVLAACAAMWARSAPAQTVQLGAGTSLTFKGFISATAFAQDQSFTFGNGQNAEYPTPPETTTDRWFGGGDVRNTRLTMVFNGPKVFGDWKVNGTVEMDFFGGDNGTGAFSGQQPLPRLRLGFADLTNGSTTIRIGQQWSPLFGNTAVSLAHIAFPLGYGAAGDVGWRFPGVFVYQTLTPKDAAVTAEAQVAVMAGSWNCTAPIATACNNDNIDNHSAGSATWPEFELRFNVGGTGDSFSWSSYVVGHVDEKDLSGPGASGGVVPNDRLQGTAIEIGAKFQIGPVMIQGNGYTGHSIGQQFGMLTQFGKIQGQGGWAQVGFDFTKNWSLFGFWGIDDPKDSDVIASKNTRLKNTMYAGMLRWRSGPFALGAEYMLASLKTTTSGDQNVNGRQLALSALFNF